MIQTQLEKDIIQSLSVQCRNLKLIRQSGNPLKDSMIGSLFLFIHMVVVILFHNFLPRFFSEHCRQLRFLLLYFMEYCIIS